MQQERDNMRTAIYKAKPVVWEEIEQDQFANPMTPSFLKWLNQYDIMREVWQGPTFHVLRAFLTVLQVHDFLAKDHKQADGVAPAE